MDVDALDARAREQMAGDKRYVSWIKRHGDGRAPEDQEGQRVGLHERQGLSQGLSSSRRRASVLAGGRIARMLDSGRSCSAVTNRIGPAFLGFPEDTLDVVLSTELIGSGAKQICMSQVEVFRTKDYACADADMMNMKYNLQQV